MRIKLSLGWLFLFLGITISSYGQEAKKQLPKILKSPADWRYEYIPFPLDFAPNLTYKGFEELRFSPGMFDTLSASYFSYAFAIAMRNEQGQEPISERFFNKKGIKEFLTEYFTGLGKTVAESRKITIDLTQIKVKVQKGKGDFDYFADVVFVDAFTNAKPVTLQLEIKGLTKECDDFYWLALVSSQSKDQPIWKQLHEISKGVRIDVCH
ncbi:MAG: hypothetical protein ACPGJS_01055 [Flammeovirgaceae bacterium]